MADPPHTAPTTQFNIPSNSRRRHGRDSNQKPNKRIWRRRASSAQGESGSGTFPSDGVRERPVLAHGPEHSRSMGIVRTRIDCARNGCSGEWSGVRIRSFAFSTLVRVVPKPPGRQTPSCPCAAAVLRLVRVSIQHAQIVTPWPFSLVPNIVTQPRPRAS